MGSRDRRPDHAREIISPLRPHYPGNTAANISVCQLISPGCAPLLRYHHAIPRMRLMQFVRVLTATVGLIEAFHATPISLSRRFRERKWHWTQGSVAKQTCIANPMTPGVDAYFAK